MDSDLLELLSSHNLFSSLSKNVLEQLLPKFTKIELKQGSVLFYQGAPSNCVFILASGRLSALVADDKNQLKSIGHIDAGETVGELGALSGEPRSLTVKAIRNSILLKLNSKDFVELCYHYPAVMFATVHPIIERTQHLISTFTTEQSNKSIAIAPMADFISYEKFINNLQLHSKSYSSLIIISELDPEFSEHFTGPAAIKEKIRLIEDTKKRSQKIVYFLKSFDTSLAKICLKKIELLYLVSDAKITEPIDPAILDNIKDNTSHFFADPVLILLHPDNTVMPSNTMHWLKQTQFSMHHHIKISSIKHYQRLLRFMRGKAAGLVLSGGGTRGWAHIGAIKALREHKIPIDMIGGSSVGAIIAACYAVQESYKDANNRFHTIVESSRGSTSWKNLTWPYVSLFNAKAFTESLQHVFDDLRIEDLWIPYFCVSSNMSTSNEEVHRSGLLWQKTRCSASIPGLIPPMVIEGELHLDGGLLNNLPVDVMRQFLGKKGRITAVELNTSLGSHCKYHFPPILTLKDFILIKLGILHEKYKFPRFIDNFLSGLLMGSSAKTIQNGSTANFLIKLNLREFRLLNSSFKQAEKMTEAGYLDTMARIEQEKHKITINVSDKTHRK